MSQSDAGTGQHDMIDLLVEDHREVEGLFQELESGRGTAEHRRDLADAMTAELIKHSVAEEEHLYPTARHTLPDGDQVADHEIEEHANVEETLKQLEGLRGDEQEFNDLVGKVAKDIRHHVRDEEHDLFPRLRKSCPHDELVELGRKVSQAKMTAPTRPHPTSPDQPPWNKILAPGAGFVDRLRDALGNRPTSPEQTGDRPGS